MFDYLPKYILSNEDTSTLPLTVPQALVRTEWIAGQVLSQTHNENNEDMQRAATHWYVMQCYTTLDLLWISKHSGRSWTFLFFFPLPTDQPYPSVDAW